MQRIPSTEVNHRMKQIRQSASNDGLVVLTSHDKPALIILDVRHCQQLLRGAEQLVKLLAANNLVEIVRAVSAADAIGLSRHADWIKQALAELQEADGAHLKIRKIERSPGE
jgi:hypothetical protein